MRSQHPSRQFSGPRHTLTCSFIFKDAHGTAAEADGNGSRKPSRKVASFPGTGSLPEHADEAARCRSRGRSNRLQLLKGRAGRHGAGNSDRLVGWAP
jgi:hypothetical protein